MPDASGVYVGGLGPIRRLPSFIILTVLASRWPASASSPGECLMTAVDRATPTQDIAQPDASGRLRRLGGALALVLRRGAS